jgi:hypothetical protein
MQATDVLHHVSLASLKALAFFFNVPTYSFIHSLLDDEVLQPGQQPSSLLHVIQYKQRSDAAAALAAAEQDAHEDRGVLSVVTADQPGLQVGGGDQDLRRSTSTLASHQHHISITSASGQCHTATHPHLTAACS